MATKQLDATAGQRVASYVRGHLGGTLTSKQLDKLCGTESSNAQYKGIVGPLVADGVLVRARRSPRAKGSDACPIYRTYRIAQALPKSLPQSGLFMSSSGAANKPAGIAGLAEEFSANGYLASHAPVTAAWLPELRKVSAWVEAHRDGAEPAFVEERSFELFRDEKALTPGEEREGVRLASLLRQADVYDLLKIVEQAPSAHFYVPEAHRRRNLSILIVENHVPFVRLQEQLKRGRRRFFGRHVDGVVWGSGSAVLGKGVLESTERLFAQDCVVRYLYWGDIDRDGLRVYEELHESHGVELLLPAYEAMLDACADGELPASGSTVLLRHNGIDLARTLTPERLETYLRVLADNLRIPQEAVPIEAFGDETATERVALLHRSARRGIRRLTLRQPR